METNKLKISKKARKIVGLVVLSLAAFTAFNDYYDAKSSEARVLTEGSSLFPFDKMSMRLLNKS